MGLNSNTHLTHVFRTYHQLYTHHAYITTTHMKVASVLAFQIVGEEKYDDSDDTEVVVKKKLEQDNDCNYLQWPQQPIESNDT